VRAVLEALLERVPGLSVLATARAPLGGLRYVGEVAHSLRPLDTQDGAALLARSLGRVALRGARLTYERACELAAAMGNAPGRIVQLAASLRGGGGCGGGGETGLPQGPCDRLREAAGASGSGNCGGSDGDSSDERGAGM